jgi:hypothetical protein
MPIHPHAVVVRGGIGRSVESLRGPLAVANQRGLGNALSVQADVWCTDEGAGLTLEQLCEHIPHGKVQVATAGKLLAAGIELVLDDSGGQPFTHHHAVLPDPVGESAIAFLECFSEPIVNPARGKRSK